jgi:ATP-binding cassette subfamily B protein
MDRPNSYSNNEDFRPVFNSWLSLLTQEKRNLRFLYTYAALAGIISLALPLGIQAIVGLVMAGRLSASWLIIITILVGAVTLGGIAKLAQISILDSIQRKLFVRVALQFKQRILAKIKEVSGSEFKEKTSYFLDIVTLQKSLSKLLVDFTAHSLQIIFGLLILSLYHAVFLFFGILVAFIIFITLKTTWKRGLDSAREESNSKFKTAAGLRALTESSNPEESGNIIKKLDSDIEQYALWKRRHFAVIYRQSIIAVAMRVFLVAVMLVMGSVLLVDQSISLGQFLAAEIVVITLLGSIEKLIMSVESLYDINIAFEKIMAIRSEGKPEKDPHLKSLDIWTL